MDRTELRRLLTTTEHQIEQGEILIQNQRWRIEQLQREGQATVDAAEALRPSCTIKPYRISTPKLKAFARRTRPP